MVLNHVPVGVASGSRDLVPEPLLTSSSCIVSVLPIHTPSPVSTTILIVSLAPSNVLYSSSSSSSSSFSFSPPPPPFLLFFLSFPLPPPSPRLPPLPIPPSPPPPPPQVMADGRVRLFTFNIASLHWREGAEVKVVVEEEIRAAVLCQGKTTAQLLWSEQRRRRSGRKEGEEEEEEEFILLVSTVSLGEDSNCKLLQMKLSLSLSPLTPSVPPSLPPFLLPEDQLVVYDRHDLLTSAPPLHLFPVQNGVWLLPHPGSHTPHNLLLFWPAGNHHVIVSYYPVCLSVCLSTL